MAQNIELKILASVSESLQNITALVQSGQDANKEFKKLGTTITKQFDDTGKSLKGITSALGTINSGFTALAGAAAFVGTAIAGAFSFDKAISAAIEQEEATNRLIGALRATGDASDETVKRFEDLASTMQLTTKFGDDLILNQISIVKSFGATNDQAEKIVKTAADLSAAFGVDLDTAVRELSGTLTGTRGKLLGRIQDIKGLSEESLKAGKAIDVLAEKFGGFAEAEGQTFQGALNGAKNAFGDLLEEIGFVIVKNEAVITGISFLKETFFALTKTVSQNADVIKESVTSSFITIIKIAGLLSAGIGYLSKAFYELASLATNVLSVVAEAGSFIANKLGFKQAAIAIGGVNEGLQEYASDLSKAGDTSKSFFESVANGAEKLVDRIQNKPLKFKADEVKLGKVTAVAFVDEVKDKKLAEEMAKKFTEALANPMKALFEGTLKGAQGAIAGLGGLGKSIAGGAAGAGSLITQGIQAAMAVIPGFGPILSQAAGPIIELLGKSEEEVRTTIRAFADGAVTFVENLITNIPVIIEEIALAVPRIIDSFIADLPRIIDSFIADGIPRIVTSLSASMPMVATVFATSLIAEAPNIAMALIKAIPQAATGSIKSGGGILKRIGFAEGGQAYAKAVPSGFPNDSFNARLTSGELVVDRSSAFKLREFLDKEMSPTKGASSDNGALIAAFSQPIILNVDGREIARAVRGQLKQGFVL